MRIRENSLTREASHQRVLCKKLAGISVGEDECKVVAICGDCREEPKLTEEGLDDEDGKNAIFIRELNDRELKAFGTYQQGTEDLIP